MTTEYKILMLWKKYGVPMPEIAELLKLEIESEKRMKSPTNTNYLTPIGFVTKVIDTEIRQVVLLREGVIDDNYSAVNSRKFRMNPSSWTKKQKAGLYELVGKYVSQ